MLRNKLLIYLLTFFLDIVLIYILYKFSLDFIDKSFCCSMLFVHLIFYYFLHYYNKNIMFTLHVILMISLCLSIFLSNIYILSICLFLLASIQIMWVIFGECILNESGTKFTNFPKFINIGTIILNILLSMKIGCKLNNTNIKFNFTKK